MAVKDPMMMQIYADVLKRRIEIAGTTQAGARGSAVNAAAACGFYPSVAEASRALKLPPKGVYEPIPENGEQYDRLYAEYRKLAEYFFSENRVMKRV